MTGSDPLIGRARELADIVARVDGGARLVTLVGPPGAGKTRLLGELAGVRAEAGAARSEDELVVVLAHALGIALGSDDHLARLAIAIGDRRVLVDNVEQALAATARVLESLLRDSGATFVVTSRERLAIAGEVVVPIGPLSDADAVALFLARADAGGVAIDDIASVREIVERLDRLPLAIELAAARTRVLKPSALLERLRVAVGWLSGRESQRDSRRDPRRATLRAAIEWSWELLTDEERISLAQLSGFVAPFVVEVAEATLSAAAPLDVIERLVEQSLVHNDGERLRVFESVREVAGPRDPDITATKRRRARAVIDAASRIEHLGPRERASLDELALLAADLEVSIREQIEGDPGLAARGLLALEPLVHHRGPLDRFIALCTAVLERAPNSDLYRARGEARRLTGDVAGAEEDLVRAGDDPRALRILLPLRGDADVERQLAALLPRADPRTHAEILGRLGDYRLAASDHEGARAFHARALAVAMQASSASLEAIARCNLGAVASSEQRYADAREHLERARTLWRELGNKRLEGVALEHLVAMLHDAGDLDAAIAASAEARAIHRAAGDRLFEGPSLFAAGCLELSRGRIDEAETLLLAALDRCVATRSERFAQFSRAWLATVAFARGHRDEARRSLSAIEVAAGDRHLAVFVDAWLGALGDEAALSRARAAGTLPDLVAIVEGRDVEPTSAEARIARRLLGGNSTQRPLLVAEDGRWFQRTERVDLVRRASLRRILAVLLAQRRASPGAALSVDALVAAGWPGERLQAEAAQNRLYTAVRTLRKLGLEGVLRTAGDGYLLDADVEIRIL